MTASDNDNKQNSSPTHRESAWWNWKLSENCEMETGIPPNAYADFHCSEPPLYQWTTSIYNNKTVNNATVSAIDSPSD